MPEKWEGQAECLYAQGDFEGALLAWRSGERSYAADAVRLCKEGIALRKLGRYKEAQGAFERSLEMDSRNADAWRNLALVQNRLDMSAEAILSCEKAIALDPSAARTWIVRGYAQHCSGKYEAAVESYARAIELNPLGADGRRAWNNRGAALDNLGRHEEAIESYDEALMIDPFDLYAWNNKGVALGTLGRHEEAARCFQKAIEIDPLYATAWKNLGVTWKAQGRESDAGEALLRAKELGLD